MRVNMSSPKFLRQKVVMLIGVHVVYCLTEGVVIACMSFFLVDFMENLNLDAGSMGLAHSLYLGLAIAAGPLATSMTRKLGYRHTITMGCLMTSVGLMATSQATKHWHILISHSIVTGCGVCLSTQSMVYYLVHIFKESASIYMGYLYAGSSVGIIVIPPICSQLKTVYGWRGTMLILSAVIANTLPISMVIFRRQSIGGNTLRENEESKYGEMQTLHSDGEREHGEKETLHSDGEKEHGEKETLHSDGEKEHGEMLTLHSDGEREHEDMLTLYSDGEREHGQKETLHSDEENDNGKKQTLHSDGEIKHGEKTLHLDAEKHLQIEEDVIYNDTSDDSPTRHTPTLLLFCKFPRLLMMAVIYFFGRFAYHGFVVHFIASLIIKGFSEENAALVMTSFGCGSLIGRLGCSLPEYIGMMRNYTFYVSAMFIAGTSLIIFNFLNSVISLVICAVTAGMFIGVFVALFPIITRSFISPERFNDALGFIGVPVGISSSLSGYIMGMIYDVSGVYNVSFYIAGGLFFLNGTLMFAVEFIPNLLRQYS